MTAQEFRLAIAAKCETTRTHYARWNGNNNVLEEAPLPLDPLPARFGLYLIAPGDNRTRVGVLDFDNHDDPPISWAKVVEAARPIVEHLRLLGHHPMVFRSRGGLGIHIWIIWDELQFAAAVRELLMNALESNGLEEGSGGLAKKQVEIFPKQDAVLVGGWASPIDPPTSPLDPETLDPLDEIPMIVTSRPLVGEPPPEEPSNRQAAHAAGIEWDPWDETRIRSALDATPADEYDVWIDVLRALLGGAKRKQIKEHVVRAIAEEWSRRSIKHDARDFDRKWSRGFPKERAGRGRGLKTLYWRAIQNGWSPPETTSPCVIAKIRIQDSDPPIFLVTLVGYEGREVMMLTSDLRIRGQFKDRVMSTIKRVMNPPKDADLNRLLDEAEYIDADAAASMLGQLRGQLMSFLDESLVQNKEELHLTNRAWRDEAANRSYFKCADFIAWRKRYKFFDLIAPVALIYVRQLGGDTETVDLGRYGKVEVWWVPLNPRSEERTPEPSAATIPRGPRSPF